MLLSLDCLNLLCHFFLFLFIVLPFTQTCLKMLPFDVWKSAFFFSLGAFEVYRRKRKIDFVFFFVASVVCMYVYIHIYI